MNPSPVTTNPALVWLLRTVPPASLLLLGILPPQAVIVVLMPFGMVLLAIMAFQSVSKILEIRTAMGNRRRRQKADPMAMVRPALTLLCMVIAIPLFLVHLQKNREEVFTYARTVSQELVKSCTTNAKCPPVPEGWHSPSRVMNGITIFYQVTPKISDFILSVRYTVDNALILRYANKNFQEEFFHEF